MGARGRMAFGELLVGWLNVNCSHFGLAFVCCSVSALLCSIGRDGLSIILVCLWLADCVQGGSWSWCWWVGRLLIMCCVSFVCGSMSV